MFERLISWVRTLFGKETGPKTESELQHSDEYKKRYESIDRVNFTGIFATSLANMAVNDCTMDVTDASGGESKRSVFLSETLAPVWDMIKPALSQALGKGGKFLIPFVNGDKVYVAAVDQSRCAINAVDGGHRITSLSVVAETREVGTKMYRRMIDYTVENRAITIRTRALDMNGSEVGLDIVADWANITPEITIANVDRALVGYLKCPQDSRREDYRYGVPITYGSEDIIRQIYECMDDIEREYKSKQVFVGADEFLFGKDNKLPDNGLFKKFQVGGSLNNNQTFFEVFDPAIRDSSYYNRMNSLFLMLEKSVGTSKGILTEPASVGATATEIKAANHDTFCLVSDIRKNIQNCFDDLAYSVDVLAEHFGLSPAGAAGDFTVSFDWDMSLVESTSETFTQLSELESRGLINPARLNAFVTGQTMEEAEKEVQANKKKQKTLEEILGSTQEPPVE